MQVDRNQQVRVVVHEPIRRLANRTRKPCISFRLWPCCHTHDATSHCEFAASVR